MKAVSMINPTGFLALIVCMFCAAHKLPTQKKDIDLIESVNKFSTKLFSDYASSQVDSNLVISPLGVWLCLSMATIGARNNTFNEMRQTLFLPEFFTAATRGFELLLQELNGVKYIDFSIANKLFISNSYQLQPLYETVIKQIFKDAISPLDKSNSSKAARDINKWVSTATNQRIKSLVDKNEITLDLIMILLNAVYFKGDWKIKFDPAKTELQAFTYRKNNKSPLIKKFVPTMTVTGYFFNGYLENLDAEFIQLPYKNEEVKMTIIVPYQNYNLQNLIKSIGSVDTSALNNFGSKSRVKLFLPKFKIKSVLELEEPLKRIGLGLVFSEQADFSNICTDRLKISKVKQQALIEVNEEGSEAAVANAVSEIGDRILTSEFNVDRPSLFLITVKNITVFMGRLVDPVY